ncbi:MAG: ABC-type transport auxiliary lipoprotein family protein [Alphaproteobacteria bacterium]
MTRWTGLALIAALALSGCASSNAPQTYDLSAPRDFGARSGGSRGQLVVAEPKAIANLDSERIAIRGQGGAISYLSDGAWGDRLPKLVQARMIQAFENANRLRSVGRPGDRLASDWQLLTDIRAFEVVVAGAPEVQVELSVKLVNDRTGRILAAEVFGGKATAPGTDARAVASAFDATLQQVLRQVVVWASGRV